MIVASIESIFLTIALIIFAGFIGSVIFKRTRVSDLMLLMLIGVIVGPVLNLVNLGNSILQTVAPFFAALVLMMLMFESGLKLNFFKVILELKEAFAFTVIVFIAGCIGTAAIMYFLGWPLIYGIILGAIIGDISNAVVIPLLQRLKTREETKIMLSLESAITDVLCVVVAISFIQIALNPNALDIQKIGQDIAGAFGIAIVLGLLFAVFWLTLLRDIKAVKETEYVLTIGVLFTLFFLAEYLHSNGTIAAFVFGLILGNSREIMGFLRMKPITIDGNISLFQTEISFFLTTFFFIYLGLTLELARIDFFVFFLSLFLSIMLLLVRFGITKAMCRFFKNEKEDYRIIATMMPRGLTAAVLAAYPLAMGLQENFVLQIAQIVFLVILFSNIITTIGVVWNERKGRAEKKEQKDSELEEIKIPTAAEKKPKAVSRA